MKVAILDDWFDTLRGLPCFKKLNGFDITIFNDHIADTNELAKRLAPFDVIVLFRERTAITDPLIAKLPNLKLISQRGVYPHIDLNSCTRHGVLLCSDMHHDTPNHAAAELTWALIMCAMRKIPQQMAHMREGYWQLGVGKTLFGRTLGLYGYGRIAKSVETYAHAFGMKVLWWGSELGRETALRDGKRVASSRELFFSSSDVVSLHVRLKHSTKGIIKAADFAQMSSEAVFVNTSRAGLIEPGAMLAGLNAGRPGIAALDVFDIEPIKNIKDPLMRHENVICTPHIGFVTEDEFELQFSTIFDQIVAFDHGNPRNMVNPEVWVK